MKLKVETVSRVAASEATDQCETRSARAGIEESAGEARQRLRSWLVPGNGIAPFLPVGRHLETLPDVHCELQRVAGVGCSWGDRPREGRREPNI
jgi:hypothetical protein